VCFATRSRNAQRYRVMQLELVKFPQLPYMARDRFRLKYISGFPQVMVAADGAVWVIEDNDPGRLLRLTPAR